MKRYGDLIAAEKMDIDVKNKISTLLGTMEEGTKLKDVWEKMAIKCHDEFGYLTSYLAVNDGNDIVAYENGYVVYDENMYRIESGRVKANWLDEKSFFKSMDIYGEYFSLYESDVNMALSFNLDYENTLSLFSEESQNDKYIACYEGLDEERERFYIPFDLKENGNHGKFCEYSWKSLFKPSHSIKNIKRDKYMYDFDEIIDIITLNPEYDYSIEKYTQEGKENLSDIKMLIGCAGLPPTKAERKIKDYIFTDDKNKFENYSSELRETIAYYVYKNKPLAITADDFWLTEKIFAINTVLDFLDATDYQYKDDRGYVYEELDNLFKIIMACKPIHIRRIIARVTGIYIRDMLLGEAANDEVRFKKKMDDLENELESRIDRINLNYQTLLTFLYGEICNGKIRYEEKKYWPQSLEDKNNVMRVVCEFEDTALMRVAIREQFTIPKLIGDFERELSIFKGFINGNSKRGVLQRFGQLQYIAIRESYEGYHG